MEKWEKVLARFDALVKEVVSGEGKLRFGSN